MHTALGLALLPLAASLQLPPLASRRGFLASSTALVAAPLATSAAPAEDELIDVYFGCGCFWQ